MSLCPFGRQTFNSEHLSNEAKETAVKIDAIADAGYRTGFARNMTMFSQVLELIAFLLILLEGR